MGVLNKQFWSVNNTSGREVYSRWVKAWIPPSQHNLEPSGKKKTNKNTEWKKKVSQSLIQVSQGHSHEVVIWNQKVIMTEVLHWKDGAVFI